MITSLLWVYDSVKISSLGIHHRLIKVAASAPIESTQIAEAVGTGSILRSESILFRPTEKVNMPEFLG